VKDLTCPLHGTSLIKQARRAGGSIKTVCGEGDVGRGELKPRHFHRAPDGERKRERKCVYVRVCVCERERE